MDTSHFGDAKLPARVPVGQIRDRSTPPVVSEGFSEERVFFLALAQIHCEKPDAKPDTHAPGRFRVNGTVEDSSDFADAFHCRTTDAMVREAPCGVW